MIMHVYDYVCIYIYHVYYIATLNLNCLIRFHVFLLETVQLHIHSKMAICNWMTSGPFDSYRPQGPVTMAPAWLHSCFFCRKTSQLQQKYHVISLGVRQKQQNILVGMFFFQKNPFQTKKETKQQKTPPGNLFFGTVLLLSPHQLPRCFPLVFSTTELLKVRFVSIGTTEGSLVFQTYWFSRFQANCHQIVLKNSSTPNFFVVFFGEIP